MIQSTDPIIDADPFPESNTDYVEVPVALPFFTAGKSHETS